MAKYLKTLLAYKLSTIVRLKRKLVDRETKPLGLIRTQWQTLAWLASLGTPCLQKDLLKETDFDGPQLTRILDRLEREDYINRQHLEGNRRTLQIELTEKGYQTVDKIIVILDQESKIMSQHIDKQAFEQLHQALDKIIDNLHNSLK